MYTNKLKKISIEKIVPTTNQITTLFSIIKSRKHNISNTIAPTRSEHIAFVNNHPYRAWYLIKIESKFIGSAYVMHDNCIGITLLSEINSLPQVLSLIFKKHKPLKQIKSIRPPYFFINIAPSDKKMEAQLIKLNANKIQSTFSLTAITDDNNLKKCS